ncbi:hypothetical protein [Xenorhabdus bovienii]|uniref:Uncharacterized protein n=1 Tax=Xenorhabdus bovienii str. kraussei Becker Underwood TaxID=1398204 RepID=A0A077PRU9_XENBV|nr:hypothetical protein [Xenorhabdus bovienii]CDH23292.1 hypothetical protein XBKB1_1680004 [Xenorhabdus bovienii str. kraussei Becker Underwood]
MEIRIYEDGSISVQTAGYTADYNKTGNLVMSLGHPPKETPKQEPTKEQTSKTYPAGMTLSVDTGAKAGITSDSFKAFDVAGNVYVKEAGIDAKAIRASHDDHIRQIVREEIRQFVNRESRGGGLFSR